MHTLESAVPVNVSGSFISTPRRARVPSPLVYYMPAAQFLDLPESRFRASRAVVPSSLGALTWRRAAVHDRFRIKIKERGHKKSDWV